jgi:hypothetical protein
MSEEKEWEEIVQLSVFEKLTKIFVFQNCTWENIQLLNDNRHEKKVQKEINSHVHAQNTCEINSLVEWNNNPIEVFNIPKVKFN